MREELVPMMKAEVWWEADPKGKIELGTSVGTVRLRAEVCQESQQLPSSILEGFARAIEDSLRLQIQDRGQ